MTRSRKRPAVREEAFAIADSLHSASIHLLRRLRREDDAAHLSAPRLSALSVVVFAGPLTIGQLAEAEQVRPPTMTRLVQALEQDGLVQRHQDPLDGRVVHIRATPTGKRLLDEGRRRRVAVLASRVATLPEAERRALARGVAIVEELLARG
jgi:DNA-binding MarR family transcriptional regulator